MQSDGLLLVPGFLEAAARLPNEVKARLVKTLHLLCADCRHPGLQTKKVKGAQADLFECRIDQSNRLIYDRSGDSLRCWFIGAHDETLRRAAKDGSIVDDVVATTVAFSPDAPLDGQEGTCDAAPLRAISLDRFVDMLQLE